MIASYRNCLVGLAVLLVCCIVMPFLLLYSYDVTPEIGEVASISSPNVGGGQQTATLRKALDLEKAKTRYKNLKEQVDELERIKVSVRNEMRELEKKRNSIIQETETQKASYYKLETGIHQGQKQLNVLHADIEKASHKLYAVTPPPNYPKPNPPPIFVITETNPPRPSNAIYSSRRDQYKDGSQYNCENDISYCIDFTKCPLTGNLKFYVYQTDSFLPLTVKPKYPELVTDFVAHLKGTNSLAESPDEACLFIVFLGPIEESGRHPLSSNTIDFKEIVDNLQYWDRNGKNHVLINLIDSETKVFLEEFDPLKSLVVQNRPNGYHRHGYDITTPAVSSVLASLSPWKQLPSILPAQRKYLLYFSGETPDGDDFIGHVLKGLMSHVKDPVSINLKCSKSSNINIKGRHEIRLCDTETERIAILKESTFALVPMTGFAGLIRLNEALKSGSIPLITGSYPLPYASVIDWKEASIVIPVYRLREIHLIIRSIPDYRILELRRQGRFIWEMYFSSVSKVLVNVAAILRSRLLHPPPPAEGSVVKSRLFGVDQQLESPSFQHNFSIYSHRFWNSPPGPTPMFPNTPWDPAPLSGTAYSEMTDSQFKTLPPHIVLAGGITGPYFENYLLGDRPVEYFTVVMLTYRREDVVVEAVERMDKLKFLAKVIVVWNDLDKSPDDIDWPEISVPVEVIQAERNSLNNRFLPYESIRTEAVLSIDDDVYLRHDEIQFAFRVWRESRDRLVGFPGRFHAFDVRSRNWLYNSNYTCELSMVLTGAAFYHKYYSYLYSNWQPQAVLEMVDTKMNCEDIAMNFLIAHITRKPPLKVTSRWTFHCPNCPDTLSQNDAHFNERHDCVNYLTKAGLGTLQDTFAKPFGKVLPICIKCIQPTYDIDHSLFSLNLNSQFYTSIKCDTVKTVLLSFNIFYIIAISNSISYSMFTTD